MRPQLLVSTLYARLSLVLVHRFVPLRPITLPWVNVVEANLVDDDIIGELLDRSAGRKSLLKQRNVFDGYVLGPCDGELDIEIAEIVVSLRRHALPVYHLEII